MHVLVTGASGFIGRKLVDRLATDGKIGEERITRLTLTDAIEPTLPANTNSSTIEMRTLAADITDPASVQKMLHQDQNPPAYIFHLAAIVSGAAEKDFELGYKVNVDGTRHFLDAIKSMEEEQKQYKPRFVFSSSMAVYGPPIPDIIPDEHATTPRSSYGAQKAIAELLVEDYTRKGYVDGVSIRFPTIAIRPGKPNKAVSSFISGIIREPLQHGVKARLPVDLDFRHPVASPQAAVGFLLHAATFKPSNYGERTLNMPSISLTVKEMIASLEKVAGKDVVALIQHDPDPFVNGVVKDWPRQIDCQRALKLGFQPDESYDDIIRGFMKDEGIILPTNKKSADIVHDEGISILPKKRAHDDEVVQQSAVTS